MYRQGYERLGTVRVEVVSHEPPSSSRSSSAPPAPASLLLHGVERGRTATQGEVALVLPSAGDESDGAVPTSPDPSNVAGRLPLAPNANLTLRATLVSGEKFKFIGLVSC